MKTLNTLLLLIIIAGFTGCKMENDTTTSTNTVTDIDGNVYQTVTIGTQVWMVENLKTTKYRNGDPIPIVTDGTFYFQSAGVYCNYNNDANNSTIYGRLYNWKAVNDIRNIAPTGWHVPSDSEWSGLTAHLGTSLVAGGKLKEAGTTHWKNPNTGATNESGFTALPGGSNGGTFSYIGSSGSWWTSTPNYQLVKTAWVRYIDYDGNDVGRTFWHESNGLSVRCMKD